LLFSKYCSLLNSIKIDFTYKKNIKIDNMNKIQIIGTEPPCARCKLLTNVVKDKVKEFEINAEVKHLVYTDNEAKKIAENFGLGTGTASLVAKIMNIEIDNSKKIIPNFNSEFNTEYEDYFYTNWTYELDEHLRPYEKKAKELGILMTPSLIINGKLMHSGSVPRLFLIEKWLLELK